MGDLRVVRQQTGRTEETVSNPTLFWARPVGVYDCTRVNPVLSIAYRVHGRAPLPRNLGSADLDEIGYGVEGQAHEE